ncbi:MAG: PspC domain-containing protein [Chitinophagaceae bacterium]|nr:PspC domain-containing protein [Chitinophagaceae bacterium]
MKKIININLSGRVIPIEDSAYEKLQAYIESLRRYFSNEESREEIINDIESRIAELLHEKIRKGTSAATDADVDEIIASMGTIEDFEAAEKENIASSATSSSTSGQSQQQQYTYSEKKSKGRLYRDSNDKFIGGVCSGIANYLNLDTSIVRILFAIITFGGFGLGILAYIILWIVLPPKDLEGSYRKRLYRNPDNRIIGGVAGGLAAYFGRNANTIRLIFAAPILLSIIIRIINRMSWDNDFDLAFNIGFGSLTGVFVLTYIILWIVLPEANSDYEKMEMRGEKVDVNRIRQNVKEGMSNMKERIKEWGEEVKTSAENIGAKGKEMAGEFRENTRRRSSGIGHAIGVIFKAFFLFIAGTIAFSLFVALMALLFSGAAWWPVNNFLWTSKWQQVFAWGTLIFFLAVPLIGFIVWVIRRIIRTKSRSNYLGWTFAGLWLIGWVCAILFASSISKDFRYRKQDATEISVSQPANGKMIVAVSEPVLENTDNLWWMDDECRGWSLSSDTLRLSTIHFDEPTKSKDNLYHVIIKRYGYGKTADDAMGRARNIQYTVTSKDSILDLGSGYAISRDKKFRFQQVHIEIQVPVGKKIRFDETVKEKLSSVIFKIRKTYRKNRGMDIEINDDDDRFRFSTGVDYTMGADGRLTGPEGVVIPKNDNDYRYEQNNDSIDLKNEIERREKELKELKEKQNKQQPVPATGIKKIKSMNKKEDVAAGPTSFSLIQYF